MRIPMIPIKRAPESLILALIDAGILIVTEDGIKCKDPDREREVRRSEEDSICV